MAPTGQTRWTNGRESYRYASVADIDAIAEMLADPEVGRYLWFTPIAKEGVEAYFRPFLEAQSAALVRGEVPQKAVFVVHDESGAFLGDGAAISVDGSPLGVEVGFQLNRSAWGRGVGTRLSQFLCAFAVHRLDAYRIEADCLAGNVASRRLLEKLGLVLEGRKPGFRLRQGVRHDELLFGARVEELDREAIDRVAAACGLIE